MVQNRQFIPTTKCLLHEHEKIELITLRRRQHILLVTYSACTLPTNYYTLEFLDTINITTIRPLMLQTVLNIIRPRRSVRYRPSVSGLLVQVKFAFVLSVRPSLCPLVTTVFLETKNGRLDRDAV